MTFAEFMKKNRKINKMSQRKLADAIGIAEYSVSRYETGKVSPQLDIAEKIANYFGFELKFEMLIGGGSNEKH